jgi:hypothetical protein
MLPEEGVGWGFRQYVDSYSWLPKPEHEFIPKRDYLAKIHSHYGRAGRLHKTRILNEFCQNCGWSRNTGRRWEPLAFDLTLSSFRLPGFPLSFR